MSKSKTKETQYPTRHLVTRRDLVLLTMSDHQLELLERNKLIPLPLEAFAFLKGNVLDKLYLESLLASEFTDKGIPLKVVSAFYNPTSRQNEKLPEEVFNQKEQNEEFLTGWIHNSDAYSVRSVYRRKDGQCVMQHVMSNDNHMPLALLSELSYNQAGKMVMSREPQMDKGKFKGTTLVHWYNYNKQGQLDSVSVSTQSTDIFGKSDQLAQPGRTILERYEYDNYGRLIEKVTNPDGDKVALTTTFEYDGHDNPTAQCVKNEQGEIIKAMTYENVYDDQGRILTITAVDQTDKENEDSFLILDANNTWIYMDKLNLIVN